MLNKETLQKLSKDELINLIGDYSKNWLAMDGLWFQSIEKKYGMQAAMRLDEEVWQRFTVIEAKRIKEFLNLKEHPGLQGLEKALKLRFYANINRNEIIIEDNTLIYSALECRVQTARLRKNMEYHPCKTVGIIEYSEFAKVIDNRIVCVCISCYPEVTDESCCCKWKFTLIDKQPLNIDK